MPGGSGLCQNFVNLLLSDLFSVIPFTSLLSVLDQDKSKEVNVRVYDRITLSGRIIMNAFSIAFWQDVSADMSD